MRILVVHNRYQLPGGEDAVFANEVALLQEHGHDVGLLESSNDSIQPHSLRDKVALAATTVWSRRGYTALRRAIKTFKPQVVHFHNTFPLLSPSVYHAAKVESIPVVQTLHNYRLVCPGALLFRAGGPCEECLSATFPWRAIQHACYRQSHGASAAVAAMITAHRLLGTWSKSVDSYIALTEFARQRLVAGGLPFDKIVVKPNFLSPDPGPGEHSAHFALFVGRLSEEKGIRVLLEAWRNHGIQLPLTIVGDGPLAHLLQEDKLTGDIITWMGSQTKEVVLDLMKQAAVLIVPSMCYEGFPMVVVEALAVGLPVVASNLGSLSTIILDGCTGIHFSPGDPRALADAVKRVCENPNLLQVMRKMARHEFEAKYSAASNYQALMSIYDRLVDIDRP